MRRLIAASFVIFAVTACSPSNAPAADPPATTTTSDTAASASAPAFTVQPAQLGGQWSFDRTCGLYDLVFTNSDVSYYDYSDQSHVVSYAGTYAIAGARVSLTLRRLDAHGAPSGDATAYTLDVTAPVTTDLAGSFGAAGATAVTINAKQCANEDRE